MTYKNARGVLPYKPGDEPPEQVIRRLRGHEMDVQKIGDEPNRQIDTMVATRIMGLAVVMRWCAYDGEVDRWREDQEWREIKLTEARPEDRVCYSDPRAWRQLPCVCGQQVGQYQEWHIVERYTTDHNAAAQMRARIAEMGAIEPFCFELNRIANVAAHEAELQSGRASLQRWFYINATPRQQCVAALKAVGVDVEVKA